MTSSVPLSPVPAQRLSITLGGQRCLITLRQLSTGLYFDLALAGTPMVSGMVCRDRTSLTRNTYGQFVGRLAFVDTHGNSDPYYDALGTRYQLLYIP